MAYLNVKLSGEWEPGERPKAVDVTARDGETVRYVPERTCRDMGARKVFFVCSECGETYRKDCMRLWHHKPWSYCPNCGARIEGAAS